jgi:hypothetical protein
MPLLFVEHVKRINVGIILALKTTQRNNIPDVVSSIAPAEY